MSDRVDRSPAVPGGRLSAEQEEAMKAGAAAAAGALESLGRALHKFGQDAVKWQERDV